MSRLPMRLPGREREHFEDKVFLSTATDKQGELVIYGGTTGEYPLTIYNATTVKFRVDENGNLVNVGHIVVADGPGTYLELPSLTTTERDALTAVNGMMIYNETTGQVEAYQAGAWGPLGETGRATTALDNLAAVAINTSLVSDTDGVDSLGSETIAWLNLYTDYIRTTDGTNLVLLPTGATHLIRMMTSLCQGSWR